MCIKDVLHLSCCVCMCVFPTISVLFVLIVFIPLLKSLIWSHMLFISLIWTCFNCRLFIIAQRNWQKKTFWWFLLFVGSGVRYGRSWDKWREHTRKDSFIHPNCFPEPGRPRSLSCLLLCHCWLCSVASKGWCDRPHPRPRGEDGSLAQEL